MKKRNAKVNHKNPFITAMKYQTQVNSWDYSKYSCNNLSRACFKARMLIEDKEQLMEKYKKKFKPNLHIYNPFWLEPIEKRHGYDIKQMQKLRLTMLAMAAALYEAGDL